MHPTTTSQFSVGSRWNRGVETLGRTFAHCPRVYSGVGYSLEQLAIITIIKTPAIKNAAVQPHQNNAAISVSLSVGRAARVGSAARANIAIGKGPKQNPSQNQLVGDLFFSPATKAQNAPMTTWFNSRPNSSKT